MDKYVLAIDHGTSGMKTALVSMSGQVLGFEHEKTPITFLPRGGVYSTIDAHYSRRK